MLTKGTNLSEYHVWPTAIFIVRNAWTPLGIHFLQGDIYLLYVYIIPIVHKFYLLSSHFVEHIVRHHRYQPDDALRLNISCLHEHL